MQAAGVRTAGTVLAAATVGLCMAAAPAMIPATAATTAPAIDLVDDRSRTVRLATPARRIVSLLPSSTETVCALGGCDRLVGVDRFSNWPPQVERLPRLGGLEDAQVERIVALKPDLVLATSSARVLERLDALRIPALALEPKTLDDIRRALEVVATALGDPAAGQAEWHRLSARIDAAARRVPPSMRGQRAYFEVSSAPHAAGAGSFVGDVLARLGMGNIVPASMGAFPKLSPEYIVRAQPQVILASDAALREMPKRPGWPALSALRDRRTCAFLPNAYDTLVRPGPRLAEAADLLVECLRTLDEARR